MNCPNCGGNLAEKGKFCPHCGTAIPADLYIKIDSRQEIIDHGRVAEANYETSREKETTKRKMGTLKILLILVLTPFILFFLMGIVIRIESYIHTQQYNKSTAIEIEQKQKDLEIDRLQKIEDEILEDIRNGQYEQALIKSQTLVYTIDNRSSIKEAWDKKREDLINTITTFLEDRDKR